METSGKKKRRLKILAFVGLSSVIVASGAYAIYFMSQPCTFLVNPGCGAPDPLNLLSSWINSPTSITLELYHGGQHGISLSSYYVRDPGGQLYSAPGWTGPTIAANTIQNVTLTIDGKDFTFQQGTSYTVTVRTSQNYVVTFTTST